MFIEPTYATVVGSTNVPAATAPTRILSECDKDRDVTIWTTSAQVRIGHARETVTSAAPLIIASIPLRFRLARKCELWGCGNNATINYMYTELPDGA